MRLRSLAALGLPAVLLIAACATDGSTEGGGEGGDGSGGSATATGGRSSENGEGGSSQPTGGTPGTGGAGETGAGGQVGTGGHVAGTGGATGGITGGATGGITGSATGGITGATGGISGATGGTTGATGGKPGATGGTGGKTGATGGTPGATGGSSGATGGSSGNTSPSGYPPPPGSTNVAKPSGSPGNITVLNWAGFKGAVSYSFDDDNDSQIANYSTLSGYGVPLTFYMWTGRTEASNSVWTQAVKAGYEIGNHTQSHQSAPPGGVQDINTATSFIQSHFNVTPYTMAAPNGAAVYTQLANGLFMTNRGVADAIIKPNDNTDRFTLPCYIPPTGGTAAANFNPEVDAAQSAGGWRIILVHGFTGGNDGAYQPVPLMEFTNGVNHTKSLGNMWIGRVEDVASYWLGQKAITSATKTTSGSSTTWTWTLPSNFVPGKYVRITVPGGTVTQKGATIPWDPHGYYEIALSAGSVTVGP